MNIQEATAIILTEQERSVLEAMIRSPKTEHGMVERARIVLLAAEGRSTRSIAEELGSWPGRISRWRIRFARDRLAQRVAQGPQDRGVGVGVDRVLAAVDVERAHG